MGAFASHALGGTTDDQSDLPASSRVQPVSAGVDAGITHKDNTATACRTERNATSRATAIPYSDADASIQHIVETALIQAQEQTKADRVMCVLMDPKTCGILAMAEIPEFDPNNPRVPIDEEEAAYVASLPGEEQVAYWNRMWRNFCVSDAYEPGSTFKLITAGIVLDEAVTNLRETFLCTGTYPVADAVLKCWYYPLSHGWQTLTQAVQNSCNPVMIQLVQRVGLKAYYEGLERFGLMENRCGFSGEGYNIPRREKPPDRSGWRRWRTGRASP